MPYSSVKDLPTGAKKFSSHGQRTFMAAFNAAHKTYGGDESKAFATAYAAAKKAGKKRKPARQQVKESAAMTHRMLADVRSVYDKFLAEKTDLPADKIAEVKDLLAQAEANPQEDYRKLKDLDQVLVPVFGELQQNYTPAMKHEEDFPGSFNHRIRKVVCAAKEEEEGFIGDWGFVLAVYPDYIVTCCLEDPCEDEDAEYWKIAYTVDAEGTVAFGDHEEVDVMTIVTPVGHGASETLDHEEAEGAGQSDDALQADVKKTDNGQQFGRDAYLIIGDSLLPSTWKVRVEESPGKITVAQLGRAYAALTKGFRGNKVAAGADEKNAALSRLRGLYKKAGAPFPGEKKQANQNPFGDGTTLDERLVSGINENLELIEKAASKRLQKISDSNLAVSEHLVVEQQWAEYPDWLLQGQDPPGGDEELVQTVSVQIQDKNVDPQSGVMNIKGIATVGNALSHKREVYPTAVWQDNIPRLQRLLDQGKLVGESDHPRDHVPSLDRTCVKYTSIWQDGNETHFAASILPTEPSGKNLITLIQNGVRVDVSSRGMGKKVRGTWKNPDTGEVHQDVDIIQRGYRCDAFDPVVAGASPGSCITEHFMAQSSDAEAAEEEIEMGEVQELKQLLEGLAAQQKAQGEVLVSLVQAKDSGITKIEAAKDETQSETAGSALDGTLRLKQMPAIDPRYEKILIERAIEDLVQQANLPQQWGNVYRKHLQNLDVKTAEDLEKMAPQVLAIMKTDIDAAPWFPGQGFQVQGDPGKRGPRTRRELIDALVADLPDDCEMGPIEKIIQDFDTGEEKRVSLPDSIRTPRRQLRQIITNIATHQDEKWNGPAVFDSLLKMEQGYGARFVKEQWLDQACADGSTNLGAGGAPSSAIFIFPLVRRVFPQLIATELASVQPMDRPDGKVFYLDNYRITTGTDSVDEAGLTISNRMRMDRSDSFSSSYADDQGECNTPNRIQLRLSSKSITAQTKKLLAEVSIEETQDLRAYHGLDAMTELISATSREVALEWNQMILQLLLNGANSIRNYGDVAPSGYTQKEWDEYITRYLDAASMDIFSKRYGTMTHIVAGPAATLKLSSTFRTGIQPSGANPEMFPGLTLNPFMAGVSNNVKMYTTGFWTGVNTNSILVLRKGPDWSDTPAVFAPYIDYVTPPLTLPSTLTQQQAIMSRAALKVVVGDAIAKVQINVGVTGVRV